MPQITVLDEETIDKIAAGEVVERPSSVVKELVENAIDAQATAVTVEIKEGGISLIRITDNGCGIEHAQVPTAFLRHSTSKIKCAEDLITVSSLGFRGEALSSIAAVAQVELITKTYSELTGTRYVIEGSKEKANEEIGAPEGTTIIVRNLFFNTPARRKFLKSTQTEGGYIKDLMERLALSHPNVSFQFINSGQARLHTSGNSNEKDMIYHIYGRDIAASLLCVKAENRFFSVSGYIGKPLVARGNRNLENYFINGRYIKSALFAKAIEDAYKGFLMQRQYPFCVLYITMESEFLDVNVHPNKMELQFSHNEEIYQALYDAVRAALTHREDIAAVTVGKAENAGKDSLSKSESRTPDRSFPKSRFTEKTNTAQGNGAFQKLFGNSTAERKSDAKAEEYGAAVREHTNINTEYSQTLAESMDGFANSGKQHTAHLPDTDKGKQFFLDQKQNFEQQEMFLTKEARKKHKIIGQLFDTYWLVEFEDKLFLIDQHAAHEKVLYEKTMARIAKNDFTSQNISPPAILSLSAAEEETLIKYQKQIALFGYETEHFGGREYALTAVPAEFEQIDRKQMFLEMLNDFSGMTGKEAPELILEKVASMSCKAAVKGSQKLSEKEAVQLIDDLLTLENPYHCPHGRPTIISMSRAEIDRKFKRIV